MQKINQRPECDLTLTTNSVKFVQQATSLSDHDNMYRLKRHHSICDGITISML